MKSACDCCGGHDRLQSVPVVLKADPTVQQRLWLCEQRCLQGENAAWHWRWKKILITESTEAA